MKLLKYLIKKYLSIKSWVFPYYPPEEDIKKYYAEKNGWIDKMSEEEKLDFLKPDKKLPLGL